MSNDNKDSNCSCFNDCVQEGSCCPDYDFFCENTYFMRKNGDSDVGKGEKKLVSKPKAKVLVAKPVETKK